MQLEHFVAIMGLAIYILFLIIICMGCRYRGDIKWLEKRLESAEKELLELRYKR